jgi:membrane protein
MSSWKAALIETFDGWRKHDVPTLSAALAYYTMLSVAPLLVICVAIAGLAFGQDAAQGHIVYEIQDLVGKQGAEAIQSMLKNAHHPATGTVATIFGLVTLLIGASGVFAQLRDSLNLIMGAPQAESSGLWATVKYRFFSFAMVFGIGFLLMVSLVVSAALTAVEKFFAGVLPFGSGLIQGFNFLVSLVVIAVLFGAIYKIVPDVPVAWRNVRVAAFFTSLLFTTGKLLIGLYLGSAGVGSAYGAAGSLVILLVWVFYSSQIFFIGAELTRVMGKNPKNLPAASIPQYEI